MAHELAVALQQAGRIRQCCAVKEPHVCVRSEYTDVAEGRISETCNRIAVVQELPDFVPTFSHRLKPSERDGSQFTGMLFHPCIDGRIPFDSAIESQEFRSGRRAIFLLSKFVITSHPYRVLLAQSLVRNSPSCPRPKFPLESLWPRPLAFSTSPPLSSGVEGRLIFMGTSPAISRSNSGRSAVRLSIAKGCALEIPRRGRRGVPTPLCDLATLRDHLLPIR